MIYYIDPHNGNNAFDGTSPEKARQDYHDIAVKPGDSVLFRRGRVLFAERLTELRVRTVLPLHTARGEREKLPCSAVRLM